MRRENILRSTPSCVVAEKYQIWWNKENRRTLRTWDRKQPKFRINNTSSWKSSKIWLNLSTQSPSQSIGSFQRFSNILIRIWSQLVERYVTSSFFWNMRIGKSHWVPNLLNTVIVKTVRSVILGFLPMLSSNCDITHCLGIIPHHLEQFLSSKSHIMVAIDCLTFFKEVYVNNFISLP